MRKTQMLSCKIASQIAARLRTFNLVVIQPKLVAHVRHRRKAYVSVWRIHY